MRFSANGSMIPKHILPGYHSGRMLLSWLILFLSISAAMAKDSKKSDTNGGYGIYSVMQDTTPRYKLHMMPNISPAQPPRHMPKVVIDNVYFDSGKSNIRPDAAEELNKLVLMLKQHPVIRVEISGHTDARASSQYNINLSQRRAEVAKKYLIDKGISADRLTVKWYDKTHLSDQRANGANCTEGDHQQSRRVEFRLLTH